jgi:hypothetical protein
LTLHLFDISAEHAVRLTMKPIFARGPIAAPGHEVGGLIRTSPDSEPDRPTVDWDVGSGEFLSSRSTIGIRCGDSKAPSPRSSGLEPTGRAYFYIDAGIASGTLNPGGVAKFSTVLGVGTHSITAVYPGDSNDATSTSTVLSQVVKKADTTTSLTSSVNPCSVGHSVTFTATESVVSPGTGEPEGTVTFKNGSTTLGTGTLVPCSCLLGISIATFATSSLSKGTHSITVVYAGDSRDNGSTSNILTQTVKQNQFVAGGPAAVPVSSPPLTLAETAPLVTEAFGLWQAAGADSESIAKLDAVVVQVHDLPGDGLGWAIPGLITLETNAAGYGWYIDPAPAERSALARVPAGLAQGHVDLLNVIAHEIGHELGLSDDNGDDLTGEYLPAGVRRLPEPSDLSMLEPTSTGVAVTPVPQVIGNQASSTHGRPLVVRSQPVVIPRTAGISDRLMALDTALMGWSETDNAVTTRSPVRRDTVAKPAISSRRFLSRGGWGLATLDATVVDAALQESGPWHSLLVPDGPNAPSHKLTARGPGLATLS